MKLTLNRRFNDRAHMFVVAARLFAFASLITSSLFAINAMYLFLSGSNTAYERLSHAGLLLGITLVAVLAEELLKKRGIR